MKGKIYLAGPFFNEEQVSTQAILEGMCNELGWPAFSPRLECFCPPNATKEQQDATFNMNVEHVKKAPLVIARIDDFDTGTIWEMGLAFAYGTPVVAYTTMPEGRGLNLMLARGCVGFLQGLGKVHEFLKGTPAGHKPLAKEYCTLMSTKGRVPNWAVATSWKKEIV